MISASRVTSKLCSAKLAPGEVCPKCNTSGASSENPSVTSAGLSTSSAPVGRYSNTNNYVYLSDWSNIRYDHVNIVRYKLTCYLSLWIRPLNPNNWSKDIQYKISVIGWIEKDTTDNIASVRGMPKHFSIRFSSLQCSFVCVIICYNMLIYKWALKKSIIIHY